MVHSDAQVLETIALSLDLCGGGVGLGKPSGRVGGPYFFGGMDRWEYGDLCGTPGLFHSFAGLAWLILS